MTLTASESPVLDRLNRLLGFLEVDGGNLALLADAADAALEARQPRLAAELLDRYAALEPFSLEMRNLAGLIALADERFAAAAEHFDRLRSDGVENAYVRFNHAWALSMIERYAEAVGLLDDEVIAASSRAPTLKVQALHHLGDLDTALAEGRALVDRYPDDQALSGAMATLAMDADDIALARVFAERAPDSPQAIAVLGMLALNNSDAATALELFDLALLRHPGRPRAMIGKGLALLLNGEAPAGAEMIEAGARHFSSHLGSWIAAGWAYLIAGDLPKATTMFEYSTENDSTFSEGHGGLAVLAVLAGNTSEAERRGEIALRLDRESLGGALAKILLLQAQGDGERAAQILNTALAAPIGPGGRTLLQMLTSLNTAGPLA